MWSQNILRALSAALIMIGLLLAVLPPARAAGEEKLVGPFPTWRDLRRDYGARGDGSADDTAEVAAGSGADVVQSALDEAAKHRGQRPVVHLPMGNYPSSGRWCSRLVWVAGDVPAGATDVGLYQIMAAGGTAATVEVRGGH